MYELFACLLNKNGLKAADVSRATGISSTVFSEWKKGKSKPNTEKMIKIANFFGVSVQYLTTGVESQTDYLYTDENAAFLIEVTNRAKRDADFVRRMTAYMSLLQENQKSVDDMIDFLSEKEKKDDA